MFQEKSIVKKLIVSCQGSNQEDLTSQATNKSRIVFVKLGFRAPKGTVGNPLLISVFKCVKVKDLKQQRW